MHYKYISISNLKEKTNVGLLECEKSMIWVKRKDRKGLTDNRAVRFS